MFLSSILSPIGLLLCIIQVNKSYNVDPKISQQNLFAIDGTIINGSRAAHALEELKKARTNRLLIPPTIPFSQDHLSSLRPVSPASHMSFFKPIKFPHIPFLKPINIPHIPFLKPINNPHSAFTKPALAESLPDEQKPPGPISQHVVHHPAKVVYQEIVRTPVLGEKVDVIHKLVNTEYQQVYKIPAYIQHIYKKPSFNVIRHESRKPPVLLNTEPRHIIAKPENKVFQLSPPLIHPQITKFMKIPSSLHRPQITTSVPVKPHYSPVSSVPYYPTPNYGSDSSNGYSNAEQNNYQYLTPYPYKANQNGRNGEEANDNSFFQFQQISRQMPQQVAMRIPEEIVPQQQSIPIPQGVIPQIPEYIYQRIPEEIFQQMTLLISPQIVSYPPQGGAPIVNVDGLMPLYIEPEWTSEPENNTSDQDSVIRRTAMQIMNNPEIMKVLGREFLRAEQEISQKVANENKSGTSNSSSTQ